METPAPRQQSSAYLAQQLFDLYLVPTDTSRLELIDALLEGAGLHDPQDRDKVLLLCDKAYLTLEGHKKALARLLLRCSLADLDEAERQMRLTFG